MSGNKDLNKIEYEERFWQRYGTHLPDNIIGYGKDKPWIPPLQTPTTLIGYIDRRELLLETWGPLVYFMKKTMWELLENVGKGDVWDLYWYNNPEAVGS